MKMVLVGKPSLDSAFDDTDGGALPVRTAQGSVAAPVFPNLAKVGAPIPLQLPEVKPPKSPSPLERPTVYPGGKVVWREPKPLSLDEARAGRRADMSNLFDVSSLHQEELRRVSQLMARQPLGYPMHAPPKVVPPISSQVLNLAGLDLPYDHHEQQAALAVQPPPSPSHPSVRTNRGPGGVAMGGAGEDGYMAAAPTAALLAAAETVGGGGGGGGTSPGGGRMGGLLRSPSMPSGRHPPKPSSRADVVQLQAVLERRLHECNGQMGAQIRAWDDAFIEVVRQVGLHCTERGALLDEIRARYNDVRAVATLPPAKPPSRVPASNLSRTISSLPQPSSRPLHPPPVKPLGRRPPNPCHIPVQ